LIRLLFVGDVMGSAGRRAVKSELESVVDKERVDFVVANIENLAGGFGITTKVLEELDALPVQVWTTGNHVWDKKEGVPLLDAHPTLLRPANYPAGNPGRGWCVEETASGIPVAVVNLQGQALMAPIDNAFRCADTVLDEIRAEHPDLKIILVDMHAEATSENHVPTADERILPGGTAFQTDVGMTGPYESIIGMRPEKVLERFLYNTPRPFEPAKRDVQLRGALIDADESSGRALAIRRLRVDVN
jgi:calcineurin-like phosphoesterase